MIRYNARNLKKLEIDGPDGFSHPAGTDFDFAPEIQIAWCRY